jgi:hypothetical protein
MKFKSLKLNFRLIAKLEPKLIEPQICSLKLSTSCKYPHLFLPSRHDQTACFFCLRDNNILNYFPLQEGIKKKPPKKRLISR